MNSALEKVRLRFSVTLPMELVMNLDESCLSIRRAAAGLPAEKQPRPSRSRLIEVLILDYLQDEVAKYQKLIEITKRMEEGDRNAGMAHDEGRSGHEAV